MPESSAREPESSAPDPVATWLGLVVDEVGGGEARVRMRVTAAHRNRHGVVHGGIVFALADAAFDLACNSHGPVTLARAADVVFLEAARVGDDLVAEATERWRRGRSGLYDVDVRRADGTLVATFRGQSHTIVEPAPTPPSGDEPG